MIWQDVVISIGSWVAIAALIPTLLAAHKPALWSSIITALTVGTFAVCYLTLSLWSAALSSAVLAIVWLILAIQKWRQESGDTL